MEVARQTRSLLSTFVALALAGAAFLLPSPSAASADPVPGYVALGDSIEVGVGDDALANGTGYVGPFATYLAAQEHNLGQEGVDVRGIALDQLGPAIVEVQYHRPYGLVVSWGGGGNDLRHFIASPEAATCRQTPSCLARIDALLNEMERTIDLTIKKLRFFAGAQGTILMRTQYNPYARGGCAPPELQFLAHAALEGEAGTLERGLNDRIRAVAEKRGAKVVDVFARFQGKEDDLVAADCMHPNSAGYDAILETFEAAVPAP
jgi:lysophospholipase L1-like esterase